MIGSLAYILSSFFYQNTERMLKNDSDKIYDIICTDIINFKRLNERYGVKKCDEVLSYISNRVRTDFNNHKDNANNCILGYLGSDKFAFIFEHSDKYDEGDIDKYFQNLISESPISGVKMKIGIYKNVDKSIPVPSICDRALVAVEKIKDIYTKNLAVYDDSIQKQIVREQEVLDSMEAAITERQFVVYYQPKCNLQTGEVSGAEALVRWIHPDFGFIPPDDFIPLFEKNGFIQKLDFYVWEEALRVLSKWKKNNDIMVPISINVSRVDFSIPNLVERVDALVKKYDVETKYLRLEVTESAYVDNPDEIINAVKRLRTLGFKFEMDDFGSGYSLLGMLNELPIDTLKLDRSLIIQEGALSKKSVLGFSLALAKWLGIEALAEGVETAEQADNLRLMGCNVGQGYYFARPLPLPEFEEFLINENEKLSTKKVVFEEVIDKETIFKIRQNTILAVNINEESILSCDCSLGSKYYMEFIEEGSSIFDYLNVHPQEADVILYKLDSKNSKDLEIIEQLHNEEDYYKMPIVLLVDDYNIIQSDFLGKGVVNILDINAEGKYINNYLDNALEIAGLRKLEEQLVGEKTLWKKEAYMDSLTQCYNRRGLNAAIMAIPDELKCAVYILDVDDLKNCNDKYGHDYGDTVLKNIVKLIENEIRDGDIVARFGGDEFVIIMKNLSNADHAFNKGVELTNIIKKYYTNEKISCSVGISLMEDKTEFNNVLKEADKVLYDVKNKDKGRCLIWKNN